MKLRPAWWIRLGDALSQGINVALLDGDANESISGRSHREGWPSERWIDKVLGQRHCAESYRADVERARRIVSDDVLRSQAKGAT